MPREARKLTKATLDSLRRKAKAEQGFSEYVADAGQPGLYAWARRGRVRFVFSYRPPGGGRRKRLKIDEYGAITLDTARSIAGKWRGLVAEGLDPQIVVREEARRAITVGQAIDLYLENFLERVKAGAKKGGRRSSYEEAKRLLESRVKPLLGSLRLRSLTDDQVRQFHRSMKDTPATANRALSALRAVFGHQGKQLPGPVEKLVEKEERRGLTPDELAALGVVMLEAEEAGSIHPSALLAVRLFALTGMRRSELLGHESKKRRGELEGLRWGDVNLEEGTMRLRQTKTGAQTRVLGRAALDLLERSKPEGANDEDPVCPGTQPGQPFVGIDRPRIRLYEAAGIHGLPGVDLHSLRHTYASQGAHVQNGRFAAFVGPLLGHGYQERSITERYIHSSLDALRPAADAIAHSIATSLGLSEQGRLLAFKEVGS